MARAFSENELVIATHNHGKLREIVDLLAPYVSKDSKFYGAMHVGLEEPEETENTFEGNARLKALAAGAKYR